MQYYIGCTGWQYPAWEYKFYPREISRAHWLDYYASIFSTVEVNYTFYRMPTQKTLKKWKQAVPKHFLYTLKASRAITHYLNFKGTTKMIKEFYAMSDILEENLGCILFQLPPDIAYSDELADRILNQLDLTRRNVIEVRHSSWNSIINAQNELKNANITLCTQITPNFSGKLVSTNQSTYLRLQPNKVYNGEINNPKLLQAIRDLLLKNPKELWIYFNDDINGNAPSEAQKLMETLDKIISKEKINLTNNQVHNFNQENYQRINR